MPGQRGGGAGGGASLYYEIANFQSGMDLRKSALTAPAGTLRLLQNADITQGGEIEKRPAFQYWCNAPAGTLGLSSLNNQVFAHVAGGGGGAITPPTSSAIGLINIDTPRSSFAIGATVVPASTMNVTAISGGALAVGMDITGPGVYLNTQIVAFVSGTGGVGTYLVAPMQVSNPTGAGGSITMTATISGNIGFMNVTAVTPGNTLANGILLQGGGVPVGTTIITSAAGGMEGHYEVTPAQNSTPSSVLGAPIPGITFQYQLDYDVFNGQIYAVFLGSDGQNYHYYNGVQIVQATGKGTSIRTYKEKMYGVAGRNLFFSAVGDPITWQDPPADGQGNVAHNGSGFINIGSNDADSENLIGMEVYYDKMAIFSSLSCQLWFLDPDPSLNQYYQTLRDAGTLASSSVRQYVANDVYFLGTHGIRSLRARDLTTTAAVADVGSPIDPPIQDLIALNNADYVSQAIALLSPRTGRIWMIFPDKIYILSNWASPNISAWSLYVPEFTIVRQGAVFADPYVVMLTTDGRVFRFGSPGGLVYDSCPVTVTTPFLSFDKPATFKFYQGFDAICSNDPGSVWNVQASFDPTVNPTPFDQICQIDGPTIMDGRIPISGRGTHVQLNITHQAPGPATLSKVFLHYATSDTS